MLKDADTYIIESKEEFADVMASLGLELFAETKEVFSRLKISRETKKEITDGAFAIGDEFEASMVTTNILFWAMARAMLDMSDMTSPKNAIGVYTDTIPLLAQMLGAWEATKGCECENCGKNGPEKYKSFFGATLRGE